MQPTRVCPSVVALGGSSDASSNRGAKVNGYRTRGKEIDKELESNQGRGEREVARRGQKKNKIEHWGGGGGRSWSRSALPQ